MLLIQRLAWLAFQGGIIALCCWIEHDTAALEGRPPNVGIALTFGFIAAFALTVVVSLALDGVRILRARIWGAPPRRAYIKVDPPRRSFGSSWDDITGQPGAQSPSDASRR